MTRLRNLLAVCLALCLQPFVLAGAQDQPARAVPLTFRELEAQGATIGEIRVDARNIFDLDDPHENNVLFRAANFLHIQTRPRVIERYLLFKTGDRVSVRVIDETERLLHANRFIYDVDIQPAALHDGVVDINVTTRDTWTLDLTGR